MLWFLGGRSKISFLQFDWMAALATFGVTWFALRWLQSLAPRLGLLDHPKGRKDHAHPTPVIGGLAMFAGMLIVSLATLVQVDAAAIAFLSASALLVVVGVIDDRVDLSWRVRIPVQIVAALVMIHIGGVRVEQLGPAFGLEGMSLDWLSVPFTVFATLGLINAINMIDGADGLAGSLVLTALALLAAAGIYAGNIVVANHTLVPFGAVVAFLMLNMRFPWRPRAKLFMGNSGSALLGFVIAWLAFSLTQNPGHPINPVFALWCVAIPVMDTLVLMIRRLCNKRSPFLADHNHMHHLMCEAGFGSSQTAVVLSAFTATCALVIGQVMRWDIPHPVLLSLYLVMCLGWYWVTSKRARAVGMFRWLRGGLPQAPGRAGARTRNDVSLVSELKDTSNG